MDAAEKTPLDIKCPWCFAGVGKPCGDIQIGRWIGGYHNDRVNAFEAASELMRNGGRVLAR